tara:strand:+ start:381 stop:515 length:135 start_codon:yes stop_codon:yes gene_type:complete
MPKQFDALVKKLMRNSKVKGRPISKESAFAIATSIMKKSKKAKA